MPRRILRARRGDEVLVVLALYVTYSSLSITEVLELKLEAVKYPCECNSGPRVLCALTMCNALIILNLLHIILRDAYNLRRHSQSLFLG
jgi:hypothetical protein